MTLGRLWAGWRMPYVAGATGQETNPQPEDHAEEGGPAGGPRGAHGDDPSEEEAAGACVFCRIIGGDDPDEATYVLWRGRTALALLNAYPYASGHLMVMPARHVGDLEELTPGEGAEVWRGTTDAVLALKAAYRPEGVNVGFNLGRAAGAGVPGHLHAHVVPRWNGDTNFMTALAEARVLPEALPDTWTRLRAAWPGAEGHGEDGA